MHRASVALKNTIASNVTGLIVTLLGNSLPDTMTVAKGVNVRFQVINGRIHHQGLALLLPRGESSIEIVSNGSVGLDETLDLQVSIHLTAGMLGQSALAKGLTSDPIVIAVEGTLDNPEIGLPKKSGWVQALERLISPEDHGSDNETLEETVSDILGGLRARASERNEPILKQPILPRLRQRVGNRRESDEQ